MIHLFDAIENPKHRFIIKFLYATGMRVSELVHLKVGDVEIEKRQGLIVGGKGNKDRLFVIAEKLVDELDDFVSGKQAHEFVFSGRHGHLSQRSVQEILKKAAKKAGFEKQIHPHTMRHSFATHYLNNGGNELTLQALLGHSDRRSTAVYAHVARPKLMDVTSPFDNL
jgi:site-specific recombinase XerD